MAGALWFKDNTLKRHLKAAPCHNWFKAGDDGDSLDCSGSESGDDDRT